MTNSELDNKQLIRLCNGNEEAMQWIQLGRIYCHEIDDLIDVDVPKADRLSAAERACFIGYLAKELYTHPFFLKNSAALGQAMINNTNNYADSVRWEGSSIGWQRNHSDWARHGWLDVCLVVAFICGGYQNMRNESAELRTVAYVDHHDESGKVA